MEKIREQRFQEEIKAYFSKAKAKGIEVTETHDAQDYDTSQECLERNKTNLTAALTYSIYEYNGQLDY
ncbi:MAG: hypothetical protein ACK5QC_15295 [Bacteroidota bacterium]|jgi:hypothetical protein